MSEFTQEELIEYFKPLVVDAIKDRMVSFIRDKWDAHVGDNIDYRDLLSDVLEKMRWPDPKVKMFDRVQLHVLVSVSLSTVHREDISVSIIDSDDMGPKGVAVEAEVAPYLSVEVDEDKPSVDLEQFTPCSGVRGAISTYVIVEP